MTRLFPLLVLLLPVTALADDEVKAGLDAARLKHAKDVETAKTKLLTAMRTRLKETADKGDLDKVKVLKAQVDAFEKDGTLPTTPLLTSLKATHDADIRAARDGFRKALEAAKVGYTKALKLEEAEAVVKELKQLSEEGQKKGNAPKDDTPRVIATWAVQVGDAKDAPRFTMKLYSNGHIGAPDGKATWAAANGVLTTWQPNSQAPKGVWVNVCTLSRDGKSFLGKNQLGTVIYGTKLADGDVDPDKKK